MRPAYLGRVTSHRPMQNLQLPQPDIQLGLRKSAEPVNSTLDTLEPPCSKLDYLIPVIRIRQLMAQTGHSPDFGEWPLTLPNGCRGTSKACTDAQSKQAWDGSFRNGTNVLG